jgi:hypothetical protein
MAEHTKKQLIGERLIGIQEKEKKKKEKRAIDKYKCHYRGTILVIKPQAFFCEPSSLILNGP